MGDYNPYQPQILGQEWVGIRDDDLFLSPVVNTLETGHGFTLAASSTVADGRFYVHEFPSSDALGQVFQISVYPRGFEAESGPIRSVIIPVNSGGVTGNASFSPGTSVADSLYDPSDSKNVTLSGGTPTDAQVDLYFATNSYAALLSGKRVVALNFLYSATSSTLSSFSQQLYVLPPATTDGILYGSTTNGTIVAPTAGPGRPEISRVPLGEVSPFWSTTPSTTSERLPWIYSTLQKFEASASGRITVRLLSTGNASGTAIFYLYAALEVIYCEEQRLAVSGVAFGSPFANSNYGLRQQYVLGTNKMPMRSMSALALNPVLAAGQYSVMLSSPESGAIGVGSTPYPILNAERQLYEIPPHPGIQVAIPKPAEDHLGDTFTSTVSMVLPQLSLHTSGGTMTEPHAYGRQIAAQVYGANTATQDIYDDISGTAATYPQVRFYARRFNDTSVPLTLTGVGGLSASTVSITPSEHDALAEIIDGWKEITLRFGTPPSMGAVAGNPAWTWSAVGERAGSRWEVLGACAPAISGVPGNLFNQVPAADRLGTATYQPPAGDTVELTWMPQGCSSPYVSGATADPAVDAILLFSQDPNPVTGIALSQLTQTVTGIGFDCGSLPCCIPSGIGYNRITWGLPVNTGVASDTFDRTVAAGGWGTASDGHTWTTSGTAADFSVDGSEGIIAPTALLSNRMAWVNVAGPDQDVQALVRIADLAETNTLNIGLLARLTDANNNYGVEFRYDTGGTTILMLRKRVAGVATDLVSITVPNLNPNANAWRNLRLQVAGTMLRTKVWGSDEAEPGWMLSTTDTSLTTGNNAGAFARDNTAAAAPSSFMFDNFSVGPPDYGFGGLELQRFDRLTGTFETIMLASSPTVTGFNDYEARVGIDSVYRIRNLNVYNFAGPWSTQVTGAPPTPGVTGGCPDMTGALIFTSNSDQSGASNAAYVMQWDGDPVEDFGFPEGDSVSFQPMFQRDGAVAFHGTERGLETFSRTLLIQAAAIDPVRLADVRTLRDLAWADLPYICVRDDIGDRWFANVRVPSSTARLNRTKYMARVDIVETTTSPAAVDP